MLDREEIVGTKQNRVLNATILLNKISVTTIPVSCVEAYRWSYVSKEFTASKNLLSYAFEKITGMQAGTLLVQHYFMKTL
ncbi:MAG: hypothetical protein M1479_03860 [Actinobacteria bacterium]|nr:hypothetical protein [Actinomycetota bacterium]